MAHRFKTVKTGFILGLLLFSTLSSLIPTASAGPIVGLSSYVDVSWSNETGDPIVPRGELRTIPLGIRFGITTGGFLAQLILPFYTGRQVTIKLEILDYSTWCTPTLKSGAIVTSVEDEEKNLDSQITLTVSEDAPAYAGGYIRMKASVDSIGPIDGFEQEFYLEFTAEYLPLISTEVRDTNTQMIGPMDTAVFTIDIENLGNARTKVYLEVDLGSLPDNWQALVTDDIIIDEAQGSTGVAYLTIRPPNSFGYHYDDASIRVKLTPARAENTNQRGNYEYVTVNVRSQGFSIIGLEVAGPIAIGVAALVIFLVFFYMRRKK